ncbi:MAG TPA: transposase [Micromonosporaceae bacterium]|nr:transposase [Micromonosporaceae bacterium]
MSTVPPAPGAQQAAAAARPRGPEPSADGGVLLLAQAWAALGCEALGAGLAWQGRGGPLLLFALVALPVLAVGSVRAVAARCAPGGDPLWRALGWGGVLTQRRLARFVTSGRHDWWAILGAMARLLGRHPATAVGADGILAVDSTVVEKRHGPHLPGRRPVYDPVQRRLVDGYELVSACAVAGARSWALGLVPHRPPDAAAARAALRRRRRARPGEPPSKLDLALRLVEAAVWAGVPAGTVVGDGAFAAQWWLRAVAAVGRHWLVTTRRDRRLRIGAEIRGFGAWAAALPLELLEPGTRGTGLWGGLLPRATLLDRHCARRGLACRAAYLERRDRRGRVLHRWYLVTSHLDWDLAAIWTHWQWRWSVEVLHRDAKQHLHLDAFHVRTWAGITALVALTSLRASLLAFVRAADPACGARSTEALVAALRTAACLVETDAHGLTRVSPPPTLPTARWPRPAAPLPYGWPLPWTDAA